MKYIFHILTFLLVSLTLQLSGQGKDVEVIDFGSSDRRGTEPVEYSNLILKTNPTSYLFGYQSVELEKTLTPFLSVSAGLGVTFQPLLGEGISIAELLDVADDDCDSDLWVEDYCDDYTDFTNRSQKVGLVAAAQLRLYFDSDSPEGGYFAFALRHWRKRYDAEKIEPTSNFDFVYLSDDIQEESVVSTDFTGRYGYQIIYDKLTLEYFLGLGVRFNSAERLDIGRNDGRSWQNGVSKTSTTGLRYEVGLRLGIQL